MLALWLLLVAQGRPPEVTASVTRTRLAVGQEVLLTVRARARSPEPVVLELPPLAGFAVVSSREVTEVSVAAAGGPLRTTTRELNLRAERPGTLVIGPVRVRQGSAVVVTDPISLTVDSAASADGAGLGPVARALIDGAPPPRRSDQVTLTVLVPIDTVFVGEQLDIVAAAWFPRDLRTRLRRLPAVTLPLPEGVWSYPQTPPTGVAASRLVHGRWQDLFVAHQVVFPLAPGRVIIPPASVEYAIPVTFSFFSREERYTLASDSVSLTVLPLPQTGRPADDRQVVGAGLALDMGVEPAETRVGEPVEVAATVSGVGNVALWLEPVFKWPPGFRAYPAEAGTRLEPRAGRVAGSKTFRYLVVPDSAGSFVVPEVRYPYYDLAAGSYAVARAAPRPIAVAPGAEPRAARALPPLLSDGREGWGDALARALGSWGWAAVLLLPPVVVWAVRRRSRGAVRPETAPTPPMSRLGRLEREFHVVLAAHVPDLAARDGDGLARALRAAGVESAVADHVLRLRDRLRAARYGPHGLGDAAELAAEIEQVLRVLGADSPKGRRRRVAAGVALAVLCAVRPGAAQVPSAEALYGAGALRAAADSFAARAAAHPRAAAHWYNLGAALYRAGADGKAVAAWTIAARLEPRNHVIRRALDLLPAPDAASGSLLAVGPVTPGEWALLAGACWLGLWMAVLARRPRILLLTLAMLAVAAAGLGFRGLERRTRPLAVVVQPATPVRVAPFGAASAAATVEPGAALLVVRRYAGGRWLEVRRRDGVRGWVLATEIVRL